MPRKKGGSDFFSWETPGKMGKAGWNAFVDRINQVSSTVYDKVGLEGAAEGIRARGEANKLFRPNDRGISYASGRAIIDDGTEYLVDAKGDVYDIDSKIRVTDLFTSDKYKDIVKKAETGKSDWIFSTQGAAVQTSGVMTDMVVQAAIARGVGSAASIAGAARLALPASQLSKSLEFGSSLLKKIPMKRDIGYSMIAQGTLGYTEGFENTLQAARAQGLSDGQAFSLAEYAGQRMAVLYSTTGVINPQTELAERLFNSKSIVREAIEQYGKKGEVGFVNYIENIVKQAPKNLLEFSEEGAKEVVQENIQQVGEIGINRVTNADANKKLMNDVMTADDFMNTSVLSFISSGLISKMKLPSFNTKSSAVNDLTSLNTLAKDKDASFKIIDELVAKDIFTEEHATALKEDVRIFSDNVDKLPKSISSDVAMPIMKELDKIRVLENEKKSVNKAFHVGIDEKIDSF